ncbi:N-acetylglucosamine-6-phosphate deacetylase [Jeotgalibacillus proteolyticus]|uniref:N-acetylglucosamine-6-phosphate deacetylase n=1 Tax=Jeotgalibacillus proteolyticus TaxID=2082395 RepID=A0A2S5GAE8_9BACL|nr:N-acetylglucosamine-6-phosphate deacetylase [Jeotgalibacillus proteolyticus]PPA69959.1 N-acetylglucosamine-6-phosphate deacetylase [Jeotgalibacillus proteolyticus]
MSKIILLKQLMIYLENEELLYGDLLIEDGKIIRIAASISEPADQIIDASGEKWTAVPGFIDLHIHGAAGHDVMDATYEAIDGISRALPAEGTTSFLATTMTQSEEAITRAVSAAGNFGKKQPASGQAEMLGIHLEGPFISPSKAGAQPSAFITLPSNGLFDQWQKESGGMIRLTTSAPEMEGGQTFISHVSNSGVTASIGHSDAAYSEVEQAVSNGANHVTHLFNQMSPLHHREPGVVGASFLLNELSVEMIVDFVHIDPNAVKLAYLTKGADRTILITDAIRAKGLPDGKYDLGGQEVFVKDKEARLSDGTLAGSILTMQEAVLNMRKLIGITIKELVAITSKNAAKQIGVWDRKGSIQEGKDADIVIVSEHYDVVLTICRGEITFTKEE